MIYSFGNRPTTLGDTVESNSAGGVASAEHLLVSGQVANLTARGLPTLVVLSASCEECNGSIVS